MLTAQQSHCLSVICEAWDERQCAPSYEEILRALDLRSKSGVHRLVTALEDRGFVRRMPYRARAVEPLRRPDGRPFMNETVTSDLAKAADTVLRTRSGYELLERALESYRAAQGKAA